MNNNKTQRFLDISVLTVKVLLFCLLIFNAFVFIYYGVVNKGEVVSKDPVRFIEGWTVTDTEGNSFVTGRSYMTDKTDRNKYSVTSTLPSDIKDNEYLFFITRKDIAVYINDELRMDFVEARDVNTPGGSIKKFYMMVPLYDSDAGAEVRFERPAGLYERQVVPETFISTRLGGYSHLMKRYGASFVLSTIVLIFSIVVFIVSIVLRICYKMKINMMYGALGIIVIACWIMTDSYMFPLVYGVYHVNGVVNYMFCLTLPFALCIYLNSIQQGRYKKGMSILMLASALNAIVWPTLHFTGIYQFYNMRNVVNILFSSLAVFAISILIVDAIKGNIRSYKYTFIGFLCFLMCCICQLTLLLFTTLTESLFMVIGLGFLLIFIVIQQVYDLRQINIDKQQAIDLSEAKTKFLASMSHEIRTPINAILGMNEMILRENKDEVVDEYSRNIKTSGKMLLMLVNDVLDFSKIEAGKMEIHNSRFLMSDMLYDVISIVKERADEKSLELNTVLDGDIPNEVISDEFRIRQILINLINNAVKYTDKGTVTLKLGGSYLDEGQYELRINVIDTGKGIREEERKNLFEAFSRADIKANANIEGTGLGLAIVKSIVDSMQGDVGVESEYGVGSDFWVKLPVSYLSKETLKDDFMENRSSAQTIQDTCDFTAPDAKILAVDDNRSNLTIVKLFLKRTGIVPDLCTSGNKAIEMCREKKYDLILLDHMMPQPDGIETLHIIRKDEKSLNNDTKVVVLTANAVAGSRQLYIDEGFDDYLTKPLDSSMLEQMVKSMLPKEKILAVTVDKSEEKSDDASPIKKKLLAIDGLDYDTALGYCAGEEELLEEIVSDIASESEDKLRRMKASLESGDIKAYQIDVHSVKSSMATIGLMSLSERAKKHEFAAKDNDIDFIKSDAEEFFREYEDVCSKLKN